MTHICLCISQCASGEESIRKGGAGGTDDKYMGVQDGVLARRIGVESIYGWARLTGRVWQV